MYERGFVQYELRKKVTHYVQILSRVCRNEYIKYIGRQEKHFHCITEESDSEDRENELSENSKDDIPFKKQDDKPSNVARVHPSVSSNTTQDNRKKSNTSSHNEDFKGSTETSDEESSTSDDHFRVDGEDKEVLTAYSKFKKEKKLI